MSEHSTSPSLLQRVALRDEDAWARLVKLYTPLVYYWCRRAGLSGEDTHDVAQDVFGAVASGLEQFRAEDRGGTFRGWLRGIARHKFLDHYQRRDRQPRAEGGSDAYRRFQEEPGPAPEDDDEVTELGALYRHALDLVRDEFEQRTWQAFWRTGVDEQAVADVARELGMSEAAVRKAKSRVLRRLKEEAGELLA